MPSVQRARHTLATYVDTTNGGSTPDYALIGTGVESLTYEFGPEDEQKFYINQESATTILKSYSPSFSAQFAAIESDDAIDWAEDAIIHQYTGTSARTSVVTVMLWRESGSGYEAIERKYTFEPSSAGGDAGDLEYQIDFSSAGDPVYGVATIDSTTGALTFTPNT